MVNGFHPDGALDQLQSFPILTESVSAPSRQSPSSPGSGSIGHVVEGTLREVLGWRPRAGDPKAFLGALNQAFSATEVDGHTAWTWRQHGYAVQADLGAITGAQASIYARARAAVDQSMPLLDGLYPLRVDADPQDIDAMRGIIREELTALVDELGVPGGPRSQRVDLVLTSLTAYDPAVVTPRPLDAETVTGHLGELRNRLGLTVGRVNTVDEEQNLTDFMVLVDYASTLMLSWHSMRRFFNRTGSDVFLGTQLVLLSRGLEVLSESVQDMYYALDSVFVGPAERQTIRLNIANETPITLSELLEWVDRVATYEGPRYIEDGGKDGVAALDRIIKRIQTLVDGARAIAARPSNNPVPGFHTPRVRTAVETLAVQVGNVATLTDQVKRQAAPPEQITPLPVVDSVARAAIAATTRERLMIIGRNFRDVPGGGAPLPLVVPDVYLKREGRERVDAEVGTVAVISATQVTAQVDLAKLRPGSWTLIVEQPEGSDGLPNVIEIPPPQQSFPLPTGTTFIVPSVTESIAAFAARITPAGVVTSIAEPIPGSGAFLMFSSIGGAPSNLSFVTRLRPVVITVTAPATLTQPLLS